MPLRHKPDPPTGASRALPAPVVLDNGATATHTVYYRGAWVAAAQIADDVAPILIHDGPPGPQSEHPADALWDMDRGGWV